MLSHHQVNTMIQEILIHKTDSVKAFWSRNMRLAKCIAKYFLVKIIETNFLH